VYAGHVGIAIGAHGLRRAIPLWLLILASQLPDWGDAAVCFAGIPVSFPGMLTHSVPAVSVLALVMAGVYYAASRDGQGAGLVAVVVVSHMLADYFTGIKPTWPGGPLVGLQLYRQPILDFVLEAGVIVGGWLVYRTSFPLEKRSSTRVAFVLAALLIIQLGADILFMTTPGLKKC
jgi:hypothetical protein